MDNQQFYNRIDEMCERLRQVGLDADADRVHHLLHKVAWTSTTELFDELAKVFTNILGRENATSLPEELRDELAECLQVLDGAW